MLTMSAAGPCKSLQASHRAYAVAERGLLRAGLCPSLHFPSCGQGLCDQADARVPEPRVRFLLHAACGAQGGMLPGSPEGNPALQITRRLSAEPWMQLLAPAARQHQAGLCKGLSEGLAALQCHTKTLPEPGGPSRVYFLCCVQVRTCQKAVFLPSAGAALLFNETSSCASAFRPAFRNKRLPMHLDPLPFAFGLYAMW